MINSKMLEFRFRTQSMEKPFREIAKLFPNVPLELMVKVIDHEPQWWFFLQEDESFFLDANCNHSFVSYDFLLQLNSEELKAYAHEGRAFISRLATEIQDSAPILKESTSPYKGRNLSLMYADKIMKAVERWQQTYS